MQSRPRRICRDSDRFGQDNRTKLPAKMTHEQAKMARQQAKVDHVPAKLGNHQAKVGK